MVRLMLVLAPVACILSGISVSTILTTYMKVNISITCTVLSMAHILVGPEYSNDEIPISFG